MHVVTWVSGSSSPAVVDGSQRVGGNIGTHLSPSSLVNSPHIALLVEVSAPTQVPLRSIVPSPQSTLLQAARPPTGINIRSRMRTYMVASSEVDIVIAEIGEDRHLGC